MPNIINNNIPTVYLLGNEQSVFVHLVGDGSVSKVYNGVTRTEDGSLARGTYTYGVANHLKKAIAPNTLEDAVTVSALYADEKSEMLKSDSLIIEMEHGQNCVIGFLNQEENAIKGGYMFSTFAQPQGSDKGLWENTFSAQKIEELSASMGQTSLELIRAHFAFEESVAQSALETCTKISQMPEFTE